MSHKKHTFRVSYPPRIVYYGE